jgi:hypothetical protein
MTEEIEIRFHLQGVDSEKFKEVKDWLKQKTNTGVFRSLLDEKYQEIKKIKAGTKKPIKVSN